jgi:hypothetical protein
MQAMPVAILVLMVTHQEVWAQVVRFIVRISHADGCGPSPPLLSTQRVQLQRIMSDQPFTIVITVINDNRKSNICILCSS